MDIFLSSGHLSLKRVVASVVATAMIALPIMTAIRAGIPSRSGRTVAVAQVGTSTVTGVDRSLTRTAQGDHPVVVEEGFGTVVVKVAIFVLGLFGHGDPPSDPPTDPPCTVATSC